MSADPSKHFDLPSPAMLPHGQGFRFVTAVDSREIDANGSTHGKGHWQLTGNEPFFKDHFPHAPIVPGVLLIESLAQFSGLIYYAHDTGDYPAHAGIAKADVVLKRPVTPPATIDLESTSRETIGPLTTFSVAARVDGQIIARGSILLTNTLKS